MAYVIVGSCIKDDSCIEVCPVDCIHPKPGAFDFETAEQLYIDPEVCIDCDACVEACPIDAIFPDFDVPAKYAYAAGVNERFFSELGTAERTAG
jgi:ferredoxin